MSADDRRKLMLKGRHPMTGEFIGDPKPCRLEEWWHTQCGSFDADIVEPESNGPDFAGPDFVADIDWPVNVVS